jgi:hypothetical protein
MTRDASDLAAGDGDSTVCDRVQELTWALMDEHINDDEFRLLDTLLMSDDAARGTYIDCVQLHSDLMFHFADPSKNPPASGKTPVLSFLGDALPPTGAQPPVAEHN